MSQYYLKIHFLPHGKHISITNSNRLMLFREIISSENHMKHHGKNPVPEKLIHISVASVI
jgi:hypothetical protein